VTGNRVVLSERTAMDMEGEIEAGS